MPRQAYSVRISFTEVLRGEIKSFDYDRRVVAATPAEARELVIDHFHELAVLSRVGYVRRIENVEVRPLGRARAPESTART